MNSKLERRLRHHSELMELVNVTPSLRPLIAFASAGIEIDSDPDMIFGEPIFNPGGFDTGLIESLIKNDRWDYAFVHKDGSEIWVANLNLGSLGTLVRVDRGGGLWRVKEITRDELSELLDEVFLSDVREAESPPALVLADSDEDATFAECTNCGAGLTAHEKVCWACGADAPSAVVATEGK